MTPNPIMFTRAGKIIGRENPMEVKQKWRFAFIVHPRNLDDVFLKYPLLRSFPPERVRASLEQMPPCLLSPVMRFNESEPKELGWLLAILLTPDLIEGNPDLARQKIDEAITAAKQAGATLVGLGGWNASLARDRPGPWGVPQYWSSKGR